MTMLVTTMLHCTLDVSILQTSEPFEAEEARTGENAANWEATKYTGWQLKPPASVFALYAMQIISEKSQKKFQREYLIKVHTRHAHVIFTDDAVLVAI